MSDDREAARLYKLAAAQGLAGARCSLGLFYARGRGGLAQDEREAAGLLKLAADQGFADAQYNLGLFYSQGLSKNDREAARLYKDGRFGEPFKKIEATNFGQRPVTVKTLAFELPTGSRLNATASNAFPVLPGTPLPASLLDGESAHLFISYLYIACALHENKIFGTIKLTPVCEDSDGGIYKGKPRDVDPDELLQLR
jgi:hypothetical protein